MISVIMLTYNRENLVARAIGSILAQTYAGFEFIIVDNGSTDKSGDIADEYAQKDKRIRVIHRKRGNIGSGRNAGLDASKGEWITFIDDDDYCDADYLEFLYNLAIDNGADISICGAYNKPVGELRLMNTCDALETMFWRVYYNNQFPTKLIHRKLFDGKRFSNHAKYDDIELMTYIVAAAQRVAYSGEPKYTFYRHGSNNSAWTSNHSLLDPATLDEYLQVYRERTVWLCNKFPEKAVLWRYFEWSFIISMIEKIDRLNIQGCEGHIHSMLDELRRHKREFLSSGYIQDFEKEWTEQYVNADTK